MKKFFYLLLFTALLPVVLRAAPPTIAGQLAFKLKPGQRPEAVAEALRGLGATDLRQKFPQALPPSAEQPGSVDLRPIYQVAVPLGLALVKARAALLGTGAVAYVEPLYIRRPQYQPNDPKADSTIAAPPFPQGATGQYYLKQIKAYRAWDVARGDSNLVIGITDSGVRLTHEDLRQQIKHNYADPVNGRDDDNDGYVDNFTGWNLADNSADTGYDPAEAHGSLVAGVAAGQADNGVGVAGVGNRCRFMPLTIYPKTAAGSFAGFEAIVYGADHGCRVIVMAWGQVGGYSELEQDACTYAARNRDVVLVAAAGNTNGDLRFYPASYDDVLSVTGVLGTDIKPAAFTYNRRVDLSAPGESIFTTYGYGVGSVFGPLNADYVAVSGTSFAAPQVAGAAALVRQQFPQYSAAQVRAQLRQSADNVDGLPGNAGWVGKIGTGRLNVLRALTLVAGREARVVASVFAPAQPAYRPGQVLTLAATVENVLQPLVGLTVTLTSLSSYLTVGGLGTFAVGNLATGGRADNAAAPFAVAVATTGIPLNTRATLRYRLTAANGYQTDDFVEVLLNPDYVVLDANNLALTLSSRGKLAYDDLAATIGTGLSYRAGPPLLSEAGLLLATSPTRVSDRLRTSRGRTRQSFFSLNTIGRQAPGPRADQEARAVFQDTVPVAGSRIRSVGVGVRQRAYAWATPARRDFVLLEYSLRNLTADTLKPLYAGIFADWDLPGETGRNVATYDTVRQLGYVFDPVVPRFYAGIRLLTAAGGPAVAPAVYSINNNAPAGAPVRLADGFSIAEKFRTLSSGTARATRTAGGPDGADVSQVVGTRLAALAPADSVAVAFAVVVAPTLAALQAAADAAQAAYALLLPTVAARVRAGFSVYPNPASGPLRVELPPGFGPADLRLLDALGRTVRRRYATGAGLDWSVLGLPPGFYTLRATGTAGVLTSAVEVR